MAPFKRTSDNAPSPRHTVQLDLIKKLRIRAWRRGTREMDLLLGNFIDRCGKDLSADRLCLFDSLMDEDDLNILNWVIGQKNPPPKFVALVKQIKTEISFNI